MKHDFNHKAETFDSPKNIFLANLVCQAVEKQIDLLSDREILDFGGGTGLLALPLAQQAKSVTLVDISEKISSFLSKIYWQIPWSNNLT